ncbi:hypothetical protein L2K70_04850 [Nocardioides KLBMP 9356]|uniref:Uncharacterized protein n=1 Tax=Nocardioides potassii TaxID=2911371 RepID=A0ABS9H9N9_9ACTN|nr:hypothetical protein [Nocardioides potassii]MCF6376924.1 hypothetical protein [Nocardioides potassii]
MSATESGAGEQKPCLREYVLPEEGPCQIHHPATPDADDASEPTADERSAIEAVIDAIEDTFLAHLPSKALSYCAQEDINAGLDALRERFGLEAGR